jgi:uncharacterized protein
MPDLSTYALTGLVGGAAAFAHCLGMCGGLALHVGAVPGSRRCEPGTAPLASNGKGTVPILARQGLWHLGKTTTYVFLGALAGLAGAWVGSRNVAWAQDALAYAAGAVMIVMGLALLGLLPSRLRAGQGEGLLASIFGSLLGRPSAGGALALGLATGFLPCPIVVGGLALAAQSGSVLAGMVLLGSMGVGTVWSLAILGLSGHVVTVHLKRWGATAAAIILVVAGLATVLRGTTTFHHLLGCPAAPTSSADPAAVTPTCCHEAGDLEGRAPSRPAVRGHDGAWPSTEE